MADCNSAYEYTDPYGRFTGTLHCDGVDHRHGLHSGPVGDGYRHVWQMDKCDASGNERQGYCQCSLPVGHDGGHGCQHGEW